MKKCVLVYDDNEQILLLCQKILALDQYRVETMPACDNVIADIERIQPDLILMDLWIPEIGGEKAILLIKENPATAHIPVLLFSANAEIAAISKKVNANGYIEKPFDLQVFRQIIKEHLLLGG